MMLLLSSKLLPCSDNEFCCSFRVLVCRESSEAESNC